MAVVEERCYVLHAQYSPKDYFDVYEEMGRKLQTETLGGLLGYYATEVGELNAVVSLWRFDTFEDRQKRRAQLAGSPEWIAFLSKVRPMIRTMNNRLLTPASFSPSA
ncbi:NIPSNAP family protein [Burkholderia multivorans]|uniref:NIPSNAP family protein n=1 Tax=Burkholderia multivorans TaxID=87883 RepID=UPI001C21D07C|nr:NIPSNAP family protein [Burkholderia multivorans]MBU9477679.1 NIPSNAP family protein [Burkholderia multivorans]